MTRALAATTVALVIAAPAAASLPIMSAGSSVGEGVPLKAYASITPRVHLFGDPVTATIAIVADTKWVDPARLQVGSDFAPYESTKAPNVLRLRVGRFAQVTWTWTLRCLTSPCVPRTPPSDGSHVFRFKPAHIAYLRLDRKPAYQISASWPAIQVVSQVSPGVAAALFTTNRLNWRLDLTPVAAPTYRLSAGVLFGLAIAAAAASAFWGSGSPGGGISSYDHSARSRCRWIRAPSSSAPSQCSVMRISMVTRRCSERPSNASQASSASSEPTSSR